MKQVKVRLRLAEAEPLYSTEQITTPDKAVAVMSDALAQMDREYCCVVNLDAAKHPINFNVVSIGDVSQTQVPMQNVFKSAILSNAAGIMLFHNHPSGSLKASMEDLELTKRLVEAGKLMNIPVVDHIIVAGGTAERFSFRDNIPDMFAVRDGGEYYLHDPQAVLNPDSLMVRPTYGKFGVYEVTGENRARVLFEGSEQDCHDRIKELRDRYRESGMGDSFTIYQLKDDESLRYIRFEGLDRLENGEQTVVKGNYDEVYKAPLKQGTTLDDIYFQFNALHPLDFRGHSLSVSDVVVLHREDGDKAFYVDVIGFTELPGFLLEKTAERGAEAMESPQAFSDEREPAFDDEAAFKLGDRYISIQRTDGGYDYSIFDEGYRLLDGGVYDNPDAGMGAVLQEIIDGLKKPVYNAERDTYSHTEVQGNILQDDIAERIGYDELMEKVESVGMAEIAAVKSAQEIVEGFRFETDRLFHSEKVDGMRPADIEAAVRGHVQQMIDEYGLDATIEDVIVSGSRCRGLEDDKSDLDVVVSFSGSEREDDLFNILHDEKLFFGSSELDINPINTGQTGTLAEYLSGVEKYLSEKRAEIEQNLAESAHVGGEPKQIVTFTVAESSEFHSFGELHEGIPSLQEAVNLYEKLCNESTLNAVPALGINVHMVGTPAIEDMKWDFLCGGTLDLEGLQYVPDMCRNAEVMEALRQIAEIYPDAEVIGRFPQELEAGTSGPSVQKSEERADTPLQQTAGELAIEVDRFSFENDFYTHRHMVEDRAKQIQSLASCIEQGKDSGIREYLTSFIEENEDPGATVQAKELLRKLDDYKPLAKIEENAIYGMEEQNYNMIDNVPNNLPKDPKEKVIGIGEHKKTRQRVSMKEKLTEKKAEIAVRDGKSPEAQKANKPKGMGVDD